MIAHSKDTKIFSGTFNRPLAEVICKEMDTELDNAEVGAFSDGENFVSIHETVRDSDVLMVQSTSSPINDNLMELFVMIDALGRASADRVTTVMPHFGYTHQNHKTRSRDPISTKLIASLIIRAGTDRVPTMDLYANQIQGFSGIPVDNLLDNPVFTSYLHDRFNGRKDGVIVVSPDVDSVARARAFVQKLGMGLATVGKRRQKVSPSEVINTIGGVRGKKVIPFDDMMDTVGSLCDAAQALAELGGATDIIAHADRGVLSGPAVEYIRKGVLKEVCFLDTVSLKAGVACDKIKYLSVVHALVEAIKRIYGEVSISELFI